MTFRRVLPVFFALVTPLSAQTITWRAANNPHVVQGVYTVAAGQTLVLEAGVRVEIRADSQLNVEGELIGNGTAANRIQFLAANNYSAELVVRGKSDLNFTDFKGKTVPESNSTMLFAECTFSGWGSVLNGQVLQQAPSRAPYLQFDRCTFIGDDPYFAASLIATNCTVVVRDTAFLEGSIMSVTPAYLFLNNVTSDGAQQYGLGVGSDQDLFLNNITVTNAAQGGLALTGDTRNGSNVLIGPNVTLENNEFPVHLTVAGLYKESVIPSTGNRVDVIHVSGSPRGYWPKFAIPYRVDGDPVTVGLPLYIDPGVIVKMTPYSYINDISFGEGLRALGTKHNPIRFERWEPARMWGQLHAERTQGGRLRHVIVDGSENGVTGGEWRIENAIFRNNIIGSNGSARVSGSQYLNNETGHFTNGHHNTPSNPNSFEGNVFGVRYSGDARNNWWGSPSGPRHEDNRKGTGDAIESPFTQFEPFRTTRPDYSDAPPEVRLQRPAFQQEPGSKTTLRWSSTDDGTIVSHKILFSAVGNFVGSFQTVATLPGTQRSYEWTVPVIGFQVAGADAYIKVVAVDNTGKESFDEWPVVVPTNDVEGDLNYTISPGQVFEPGQLTGPIANGDVDRNLTLVEGYIEIIGAPNRKMYTNTGLGMPFVSSDTVRFVTAYGSSTNRREYWYSPIFSVRPKALLGDAPPTVALGSPAANAVFAPGAVVPITWTAEDDEGLRAFDIVASFNDGRTWEPIVQDLPGSARSYDWQTAPGSGFPKVRVIVIAKDWRFQTSSAGRERVFSTNNNNPNVTVTNLTLNPITIATSEASTGTVTLNRAAPAGGTVVTLASDTANYLIMPANVTVPAGATSATFTISAQEYGISHTFQISATAGGVTVTAPLTVTLALTDIELPPEVASDAEVPGTVELSGPAPSGGALVYLQSSDTTVATVPSSVTIPEGATSAQFVADAKPVSTQKTTNITGTHAGRTQSVTISVVPGVSGFDSWRAQHFPHDMNNPAISGPTADPDRDGIGNMLEYKLAMLPNRFDQLPQPIREGGRLTMTYKVAKAATDFALKVEVGSDFAQLGASTPDDTSRVVIGEDTHTQSIKATDTAAPVNAARRLMRLVVMR